MAGGLSQLDAPGYYGLEDLVLEEAPHLFLHLLAEVGSGVVHGEHHPAGGLAAQSSLHHLYDLYELAHALQGVELGLKWYQEQVAGGEAVDGEQAQAGGRVYDHVVIILQGGNLLLQDQLPGDLVGQLRLRSGEVDVAWSDEEAGDLCGQDGILEGCIPHHHVVHLALKMPFVYAQASAGCPLGIEVDQKNLLVLESEVCGEVDGCGRLAAPSFMIADGNHPHE